MVPSGREQNEAKVMVVGIDWVRYTSRRVVMITTATIIETGFGLWKCERQHHLSATIKTKKILDFVHPHIGINNPMYGNGHQHEPNLSQ